jgi:hypothetical protein
VRPAAKPAQVPKGTFPTPLEPVRAPGRDSGEAASTDIPRGARSAREQRHRLRASPAGPTPDAIPNPMKPSARPARARRLSKPGRASPEQDRLALPATPQGSARLTDSITGPNARSTSHHAPGPGGESRGGGSPPKPDAPRKANPSPRPVSGTQHPRPVRDGGWRSVRCPRRQAGRHRARTGPEGHRAGPRDPNQAVVLHEEDRPPDSFGVPHGRSPPRRRPCEGFRRNRRGSGNRTQIASEPDHPANAPQPCGVWTVPQTVLRA